MICLSFDIEERFHSHLAPDAPRDWHTCDQISRLIDFLIERKLAATFFIVGELAEKYPELVRRIAESGLEVAAHGYRHQHLGQISRAEAQIEIARSKDVLEAITGQTVLGFRAPSWSAQIDMEWYWEFLPEQGFVYDSSLFPFRTKLYGSNSNPVKPFPIRPGLLEIPPSVIRFGSIRVPFGGGFYFRLLPLNITTMLVNQAIRAGCSPVVYFHPWEFEQVDQPIESGLINRFIGNVNIGRNWEKFMLLTERYECQSLSEFWRKSRDMTEQVGADQPGSE